MKYLLVDVCIHKHITCYYYASCINTIQLKLNELFNTSSLQYLMQRVLSYRHKIVAHLVFLHLKSNKSYIFYLSNFMQKMHIKQVGELYQHKLYNYDQMVLSISLLSFFSSLSSLLFLSSSMPRGGWRRPRAFT